MNWIFSGSVLMFLGVALGAFGAHGLKNRFTPELMQIFETGVRYQIYHSLALLVVAWIAEKSASSFIAGAGWSFLVGILLFSGSLYIYTLSGIKAWAMVTPVGGLFFLIGWCSLAVATLRRF